jgi:endonuclease I
MNEKARIFSALMKRPLLSLLTVLMTASGALADTVAYWNFNSLVIPTASAPGVGGVPTSISVNQGTGTLSLTGWIGLVDDFGGSTINAISPDASGASLSVVSNAGNNSFIELQLNLADFGDPIITFATRGTSTGFNSGVWSYSVAGGAFTTISGVNTATTSTTFALASVDLSAINAVDGQANVRLRYTLSGATNTTGNNRIDNLLVSATQTTDSTPPLATALAPLDNAASVPVTSTPTITFNENVKKGTGSILIKRSSDSSTLESIDVTTSQVTVTGAAVTITPSANFANSTGYYIEVPAGAIEDIAGNDYAGISGTTAWNFTTIAASVLPSVTETFTTGWRVLPTGASTVTDYYAEGNGQGAFARFDLGIFNMSKLDFGLSGASTITSVQSAEFTLTHNDRTFTQGTEVEFFFTTDAATGKTFDAAQVNGINNSQFAFAPISLGKFPYTPKAGGQKDTFTLDLAAAGPALVSRLNTGEDFSIIIAATTPMAAVTYSGKGNTFDPGDPSLKLTVNETTGVDTTPPAVAFFTPVDGSGGLPISSNIRINFNELIQKGSSGAITIYRSGDNSVFETIHVTSPNITTNLGTVTIDPVGTLESAGSYYVQITPGAIEDTSGNDFVGIADSTTWNFSTAQPPITATGPFGISQNARAGTVIGQLNSNINGKEGIKYSMVAGSGGTTMMKATPDTGYLVNTVFTIGDTVTGATGALNPTSAGSFSPVGTLDGLGAFSLNANTVRVFSNHEIELPASGSAGYPYTLANGTIITKGGARVSYFDIDKTSRRVVDAGLAIARMYDRSGNVVTNTSQLDMGGLDRMCSASLYEPNLWGAGRGLVDRIYITGEETSTDFGHPHGGTYWALDTSNGDFWALPDMGRGSWENAALVDTGTTTHVAFLLGDDSQSTPLYLYVGEKIPAGNFVERNGLKGGQLYVWKATNGNTTPQQFNGSGSSRAGSWVALNAKNVGAAGTAGHDVQGYKNDSTLHNEADALGAFSFSRPEDLSTSPTDGSIVAFTSTGRGTLYSLDNWGDTYILDIDFDGSAAPTSGFLRIIYSGDDAGNGQFMSPEEGLRCPDNLDWADDGSIYVQEDQSNQVGSFGAAGFETSIWRLDIAGDYSDNNPGGSIVAQVTRVTQTDRSTVLPLGSTDTNPGDVGNWESSGIIDVSSLFGEAAGTLFLFDIQAHSVNNGLVSSKQLFEGGQLCFLERGIETGAFALNPNTGVLTLANPSALDATGQPSHTLRLHAFDGTNHTLGTITINVTNAAVPSPSNSFKMATFNTSHYRDTDNALINDLSVLTNTASQSIARVIQRNNADIILINEFDYDAGGKAIKRFKENYLEVGQSGEAPVYYPYAFFAPVNTGVHSGKDLDNNGSVVSTPGAAGYGEDAFGFGLHPGQYGFVVLSKFPIDKANARTFQKFLWKDMPGAMLPDNPNIAGPADWYSTDELAVFRLSSKTHADVPVNINGTILHVLASHPTPPVFDEGAPWITGVDHNGRRNSDEIRFWNDYITPASSAYIYDDTETSAAPGGGLPPNSRFVICGDQNSDNNEGDGTDPAIKQLIGGIATVGGAPIPANILVNSTFVPGGGAGTDADDTAAFSGGVRVDYVLPSVFGLTVDSGGVFWPSASSGDPIVAALSATDHHLVYVNLTLSGVTLPPNTDLLNYYAPAQGLTGSALQTALHNIIDDHVVIDYGTIDEVMQVIDEAAPGSPNVRLLYSNATLPKTSNNISGGWNREHVWPRSDGVGDEGPDYSDLHHLFPCKDTVNSLRSNDPYDVCANTLSDPFAPESHGNGSFWEPLDRDKGIVARAQLYMMTRYDGGEPLTVDLLLADNTSPTGTQGVLSTLLAWHKAFPPTDYERSRNNAIYAGASVNSTTYAQGNRNPFIDFPQFADAIFLNTTTQSFNKWQLQRFSFAQLQNSTLTGPNGDADGDGRSNYFEFLLGGNPNAGSDEPLAAVRTGNQFTLTFRRPKGITEQARIESSPLLVGGTWQTVLNWQSSSIITDLGDYERIDFTTTIPAGDGELFYRVVFE